jgi:hypothetical protein
MVNVPSVPGFSGFQCFRISESELDRSVGGFTLVSYRWRSPLTIELEMDFEEVYGWRCDWWIRF